MFGSNQNAKKATTRASERVDDDDNVRTGTVRAVETTVAARVFVFRVFTGRRARRVCDLGKTSCARRVTVARAGDDARERVTLGLALALIVAAAVVSFASRLWDVVSAVRRRVRRRGRARETYFRGLRRPVLEFDAYSSGHHNVIKNVVCDKHSPVVDWYAPFVCIYTFRTTAAVVQNSQCAPVVRCEFRASQTQLHSDLVGESVIPLGSYRLLHSSLPAKNRTCIHRSAAATHLVVSWVAVELELSPKASSPEFSRRYKSTERLDGPIFSSIVCSRIIPDPICRF